MANFYVLVPPGSGDPEKDTLFIRDGFSWPAFLFPLVWLIVRGLWLIAGLSLVIGLLAILGAEYLGLDGLPLAFGIILSLWTGLEGGHVRAYWLLRKGWDLKATIAAHDLDEAEALYFAGEARNNPSSPARAAGMRIARPADTVPLGLIGPYGSR